MLQLRTILYVDDNARSGRMISTILKTCGLDVILCADPVDVVSRLHALSFDLALLDYQMPGMTGSQVAQEIKGRFPDIPVVMISGFPSLPPSELLFVDAYVGRGATIDELLYTLRMLLPPDSAPVGARKRKPLPRTPRAEKVDAMRAAA